jgi:hypothetical protein
MTRDATVGEEAVRAAWDRSRLLDNQTPAADRALAQQRIQFAIDTHGRHEVR